MHTTLRHPGLRLRDIKHIVALKRFDIQWDRGQLPESEWVYASLEDDAHRGRLVEWLRSKNILESADAFVLGGYNDWTSITWGEILAHPEKFFDSRPVKIISKDLDWRLDYRQWALRDLAVGITPNHLTMRWSQPLAGVVSCPRAMKQLSMLAKLAVASGGSACSR